MTDDLPGPNASIDTALEHDTLLAAAHPDSPHDPDDPDAALIKYATDRMHDEQDTASIRLTPSRRGYRLELQTHTLEVVCHLDDVDFAPTNGGSISRRTAADTNPLIIETTAREVYELAEGVAGRELRRKRREIQRERNTPHASLTVGERNPGL